jgi:ectoine hydroxylase-related dioxygenase (phytanoyl-CoA dioxygenase family)
MEPTLTLTQEQIDFFHREGYLSIPALTTPDEVNTLSAVYDRIFQDRAGRDQGDHLDLVTHDDDEHAEPALPQILNPSKYAQELTASLLRANAAAIAKQLMGPETTFRGDHAIRKPARHGAATPWHQDEAYNAPELDYNEMSIWVPLQEATLKNGCMQFVPRSHRWDIAPHHPIGHDPKVIGLEVDDPDALTAEAVACELPPGGATIHHCKTMHYTGPNLSDGPRRAYIMLFGAPPTKRNTPRDFYWLRQQQTAWQARAAAAAGKQ